MGGSGLAPRAAARASGADDEELQADEGQSEQGKTPLGPRQAAGSGPSRHERLESSRHTWHCTLFRSIGCGTGRKFAIEFIEVDTTHRTVGKARPKAKLDEGGH